MSVFGLVSGNEFCRCLRDVERVAPDLREVCDEEQDERDLGYYAVPREATLAEVVTALDCSENAASTLLRNGERILVDAALGQ